MFFPGKRKLRCGEKLARLRDGIRRRRFTVASVWNCARNVLRVPGDFFSSLLTLCYGYGTLHVLRHFVHSNWCIKAMRSTVVCCNSFCLF